jgi:uncharacterized protein YceK
MLENRRNNLLTNASEGMTFSAGLATDCAFMLPTSGLMISSERSERYEQMPLTRRQKIVFVVVTSAYLFSISGCGTMATIANDKQVCPWSVAPKYDGPMFLYSGIRCDYQGAEHSPDPIAIIFLWDMPFSILADTFAVPFQLSRRKDLEPYGREHKTSGHVRLSKIKYSFMEGQILDGTWYNGDTLVCQTSNPVDTSLSVKVREVYSSDDHAHLLVDLIPKKKTHTSTLAPGVELIAQVRIGMIML